MAALFVLRKWAHLRSFLTWLLAVSVGAVAIAFLVHGLRRPIRLAITSGSLISASGFLQYRASEARLSGNFPYKKSRSVFRGSSGTEKTPAQHELPFLEIVAQAGLNEELSVEQLHNAGVAYLFLRDYDSAVRAFQTALRRAEMSAAVEERAAVLTDLAAAYVERARSGDRKDFILALDAIEKSWRIRRTPAAAWTRALLFETLNLKTTAARAWHEYLMIDPSPDWAVEARAKLAAVMTGTTEFSPLAKRNLLDACAENRVAAIAGIAAAHPREARMFGEEELLPAWADALLARGADSGSLELRCASLIGEALRQQSGEALLGDAVSKIAREDVDAARAISAYRAGRDAYIRRDFQTAEPMLQDAEDRLRRSGNPLAMLADVYHAGALHWTNRYAEVVSSLDEVQDPCIESHHYRAACGLRKWITGLAFVQTGRPGESIVAYDEAIEAFRSIGERENTASVLGLRAETLDLMTAFDEAWTDRLEAVAMFPGWVSSRPTLWKSVAAAAVRDHYEYAADVILTEIAADARQRNDRLYITEALMWQALARSRIDETFAPDTIQLERALASIEDPDIRARTQANLQVVLAEILADSGNSTAADGLDRALAFYRHSSDQFNAMSTLTQRASARAAARDYSAADVDLIEAAREFERQAADIADPFLRVLFSDRQERVFRAACEVQVARGNYAAALWFSDAARKADLPGQTTGDRCLPANSRLSPEQLGRGLVASVPHGTTVVHEELSRGRLFRWIIREQSFSFVAIPVDDLKVVDEIERLLAATEGGHEDEMLLLARSLYDTLLRDVETIAAGDALVFSLDRRLRKVPIALLYDGRRFLTQKRLLASTRSIGLMACDAHVPTISTALLVAPDEDDGSQRLAGTRSELAALQGIYGSRARRLTGPDLTPSVFLQNAADSDMIHVGAHGRTDRRPLRNALEFGTERLRAFDVLSVHLKRGPIVVLAACRTSDDTEGRSSISLATAFTAAGASAVIGTLWDVDDERTVAFIRDIHQSLARGLKPQDALQAAQQSAIRRGETPDLWAGFQLQI
jgi:CHAT domain-containing protein/tetratricopeptide (TPR) repeat protein